MMLLEDVAGFSRLWDVSGEFSCLCKSWRDCRM